MAKKTAKKTTRKSASKKQNHADGVVQGLVNLVNKHVNPKKPALEVSKIIFYVCGRLILEEEGQASLKSLVKEIIED